MAKYHIPYKKLRVCFMDYDLRGVHKRVTKCHLAFIIIMYQKSHFNMRDSLSRFALKVRDKNVKHLGKLGGNYGTGIEVI